MFGSNSFYQLHSNYSNVVYALIESLNFLSIQFIITFTFMSNESYLPLLIEMTLFERNQATLGWTLVRIVQSITILRFSSTFFTKYYIGTNRFLCNFVAGYHLTALPSNSYGTVYRNGRNRTNISYTLTISIKSLLCVITVYILNIFCEMNRGGSHRV